MNAVNIRERKHLLKIHTMENSTLIYIISLICAILIGKFITAWYHQINKRVRIQQAQLHLLAKMAEQSQVPQEEILKAYNHANGHDSLEKVFGD